MRELNPQDVPDVLDIIFEKRNKAYGAYELRQTFPKYYKRAAFIGILASATAITSPFWFSALGMSAGKMETKIVVTIDPNLPPPPPISPHEPPPPPQPPPPSVRPSIRFVPPSVVADERAIDEVPPPEVQEMANKDISTQTVEGDPNATPTYESLQYEPAPKAEDKLVVEEPSEKKPEESVIFDFGIEQQPEYPGGAAAMNEFLQSNIQYPEIARRAGIEGKVFVQFVVDPKGDISQVTVVRGIGGGCDEEAKRVVNAMPHWRPGRQNGRAVSVRYTIQVTFKLR